MVGHTGLRQNQRRDEQWRAAAVPGPCAFEARVNEITRVRRDTRRAVTVLTDAAGRQGFRSASQESRRAADKWVRLLDFDERVAPKLGDILKRGHWNKARCEETLAQRIRIPRVYASALFRP